MRPIFDAIVCDPPYGVRARSSRTGVREKQKNQLKVIHDKEQYEPYYSQKQNFDFFELHDLLLDVAASLLV